MRRGLAATHMVYGVAQTINAANLLMFKAMRAAKQLSNAAVQILIDRVIEGHVGQGMDLHWSRQTQVPTEADYFAMVDGSESEHEPLCEQILTSLVQRPVGCSSSSPNSCIPKQRSTKTSI